MCLLRPKERDKKIEALAWPRTSAGESRRLWTRPKSAAQRGARLNKPKSPRGGCR